MHRYSDAEMIVELIKSLSRTVLTNADLTVVTAVKLRVNRVAAKYGKLNLRHRDDHGQVQQRNIDDGLRFDWFDFITLELLLLMLRLQRLRNPSLDHERKDDWRWRARERDHRGPAAKFMYTKTCYLFGYQIFGSLRVRLLVPIILRNELDRERRHSSIRDLSLVCKQKTWSWKY